jgi:phosphoribosylanthranilate isomerase
LKPGIILSMVKVKICGITNLEDAKASIDAGCDALGFVFYKKSPRYIDWKKARDIISALPKSTIKVGIFVDSRQQAIKRIAKLCELDILQFHGKESPEFCGKFRGYKIIKAFRIQDKIDLERILKYKTFAYLFDTYVKNKAGGTGKKFNWKLLTTLSYIKRPVFLSGGLSARNVKEAVKVLNPPWVDVSSSVETAPGKKDHKKVKRFIKIAKNTAL